MRFKVGDRVLVSRNLFDPSSVNGEVVFTVDYADEEMYRVVGHCGNTLVVSWYLREWDIMEYDDVVESHRYDWGNTYRNYSEPTDCTAIDIDYDVGVYISPCEDGDCCGDVLPIPTIHKPKPRRIKL